MDDRRFARCNCALEGRFELFRPPHGLTMAAKSAGIHDAAERLAAVVVETAART